MERNTKHRHIFSLNGDTVFIALSFNFIVHCAAPMKTVPEMRRGLSTTGSLGGDSTEFDILSTKHGAVDGICNLNKKHTWMFLASPGRLSFAFN